MKLMCAKHMPFITACWVVVCRISSPGGTDQVIILEWNASTCFTCITDELFVEKCGRALYTEVHILLCRCKILLSLQALCSFAIFCEEAVLFYQQRAIKVSMVSCIFYYDLMFATLPCDHICREYFKLITCI